jgi:hypothetical protein
MSLEPKPRSMAAVTITVNRKGQLLLPCGRYKIWLFAGTSEYLQVLPHLEVTIRGVRTISRKDHALSLQARTWNPQRPYARPSVPEGRYGPICMATCSAWQNRNDHASARKS